MKGPSKYSQERILPKSKPRKVLNLEERVQAIKLYDRIPVYQRIASIFKCSWEQIKGIILKREDILKYYARCQIICAGDSMHLVRQKKINFLGNVMYEYIKRAHFHYGVTLDDEAIRQRALEFRNLIKIEKFHPNKTWINDFKQVYNVNMTQIIVETPNKSLNSKDILIYCRREVERTLESAHQPVRVRKKKAKSTASPIGDHADNSFDGAAACEEPDFNYEVDDTEANIENETGKVIYFGNMDAMDVEDEVDGWMMDDEDGPTIDYSNSEYNDEEEDIKPIITAEQLMTQNQCFPLFESAASNQPTTTETETETETEASASTSGAHKRKRAYESSPLSPLPHPPPPSLPSTTTSQATQKEDTNEITRYEEALQLLRPLEDFALKMEDGSVMDLLAQLAELYEQAAKRQIRKELGVDQGFF